MPSFPYPSFRPGQREVAEQVARVVREGSILLLQAPTGFGKTAAVVYGLIEAGAERVLYVVRTRNEIQPVVRELRRFGASYTFLFSARRMCPLLRPGDEEDVPGVEEFWETCRLVRLKGACSYYSNLDQVGRDTLQTVLGEAGEDPFLAVALLAGYGLCPFFALKMLVDDVTFVVATYPYLFNPDIFGSVFEPRAYEDFVVVVDEAHSLMEAHTLLERRLSLNDIERAAEELAERYGKESEHVRRLQRLRTMIRGYGGGMARLDASKLLDVLGDPEEWFDVAHELRVEKLARALEEGGAQVKVYSARVAAFLDALAKGARAYVYSERGKVVVKAVPSDPCVVTEEPLNRPAAVVLMSGTMPPASYVRDVLCVRKPIRVYDVELFHPAVAAEYGRWRRTIVAAEPTSRFTERGERMFRLYASYIEALIEGLNRGAVLIVFPSYEFMEQVLRHVRAPGDLIAEGQDTVVSEVARELRERAAREVVAVAAVASGKLVEGVEFVDEEGRSLVRAVFVAGLPYPQPDATFEDYLAAMASKLGEDVARDYAYNVTASVRVRQAVGRAQRRPGDRVVVVLADRRFLYRRIRELVRLKYDSIVFSLEGFKRALARALRELGLDGRGA